MNSFLVLLTILSPLISTHNVHKHFKHEATTVSHFENHNDHANFDRDALFGSNSNADELNQLEPEEAKRRLRDYIVSGKMDADADGYVNREELSRWVLNSFQSISRQDASEQMKEEDENNDKKISWEEHFKNNFNLDQQNDDEKEMIYEDQELYKAADQDGDGLLDEFEYALFTSPEDHKEMHDTLFKLTMKRRDTDLDGRLSFKEYIVNEKGVMPYQNSEGYLVDKDKFNNDYDKNHDGYLDRDEVISWIIPNSVEIANEEADHLIAVCDDNKDQKLTLDEIVNNYDVFLESEVTQYGDKLKDGEHDEL